MEKINNISGALGGEKECGSCGENVKWEYSNGTLYISGSGDIVDFIQIDKNNVKAVVIEEGITGIGSHVFKGYSKLESINIPEGVKSIGEYALDECSSLEDMIIQKEEKIEVKEWEHVTEDEWERINLYHCEDGKSKKKNKKRRYNRDI